MWRGRSGHQFLSPAPGARAAAGGELKGTQLDAWTWLPMGIKHGKNVFISPVGLMISSGIVLPNSHW